MLSYKVVICTSFSMAATFSGSTTPLSASRTLAVPQAFQKNRPTSLSTGFLLIRKRKFFRKVVPDGVGSLRGLRTFRSPWQYPEPSSPPPYESQLLLQNPRRHDVALTHPIRGFPSRFRRRQKKCRDTPFGKQKKHQPMDLDRCLIAFLFV